MANVRQRHLRLSMTAVLFVLAAGAASADDGITVQLNVPILVCHEQAGGVRPPDAKGEAAEHDNVFFVLAGRGPDGKSLCEARPHDGAHLKIDNTRATKFVKGVNLWKGTLKDGQTMTLILSVREQDGDDSAADDLKEAAEITTKVDNDASLRSLARIPIHEVLHGKKGENDHIGTVVVRVANAGGKLALETEPGADARPLKGVSTTDPNRRAFALNGDHSHYDLHLELVRD